MVFIIKRGNQEIGRGFIIRLISFPTRLRCSNSTATHTGKPRDGQSVYEKLNLQEYVRSGFQSHGNSRHQVSILFENSCLEEVIQRFGTKEAQYSTADSDHFVADANVEIENTFYNWLLSFGTSAKILKPEWAAEAFRKYIDDIKNTYTTKP